MDPRENPKTSPADRRWLRVEAMPPDEHAGIYPRLGICAECLSPALYAEADLAHTIIEAICHRCARQFAMPLEEAS